MPTYTYKCKNKECDSTLEVVQKMTDPKLTDCPVCGTVESLEKVITNGNFHLKGHKWVSKGGQY